MAALVYSSDSILAVFAVHRFFCGTDVTHQTFALFPGRVILQRHTPAANICCCRKVSDAKPVEFIVESYNPGIGIPVIRREKTTCIAAMFKCMLITGSERGRWRCPPGATYRFRFRGTIIFLLRTFWLTDGRDRLFRGTH